MLSKSLIAIGLIIIAFSLFPFLLLIFRLIGTENALIGSFGFSVFSLLTLILGLVLIMIGTIISYRNKVKSKNDLN